MLILPNGTRDDVSGNEQVTSQVCFIKAPNYSPSANNCEFVNYAEVFMVSSIVSVCGFFYEKFGKPFDSKKLNNEIRRKMREAAANT
jgi:hypothetical protein